MTALDGMIYTGALQQLHHSRKGDIGRKAVPVIAVTPQPIIGRIGAVHAHQDGAVMAVVQLITGDVLLDLVLNL